jgi:hypothetical protein
MLYQLSYALLNGRGWSSRIGATGQWMRKSASIIGNRIGNRGRRGWSGPDGDIAGFMLRADTGRKHREQDGEPDGQKKPPPPPGSKQARPASSLSPHGPGPRAVAPPRELVTYNGRHSPGTIVISAAERRLYYILRGNQAVK